MKLPTETSNNRLRVFISYSRLDENFAQVLRSRLIDSGFDAYIDIHDIVAGEPWRQRLHSLIETADAVVFLISPSSVASEMCSWEINEAELLGKRILPLVCQETQNELIPQRLQRLNYIFMETAEKRVSEFLKLRTALEEDTFWVREHTRLGELAGRWDRAGHPSRLLLRGSDITDAEGWRASRPTTGPEVSVLQSAYLAASRTGETNRQRWWLGGATGIAILTTALSAIAVLQYFLAEENAIRAEREAETATLQREAALVSTELADRPRAALERALAAANRYRDARADGKVPKIAEVQASLFEALAAAREKPRIRGYMHGSYFNVKTMHPLPDNQSKRLLVATQDVVVITDADGRVLAPLAGAPDGSFGFLNDALWLGPQADSGFAVASGSRLESKNHNGGIRFYDGESRLVREVLTDNPWPFLALAHLPSKNAIVAGDAQGNLFRIDRETYEHRKVLDGNSRPVTGLAHVGFDPGVLVIAYGPAPGATLASEERDEAGKVMAPAIDKALSAQIVERLGEDSKLRVFAIGTGASAGITCLEMPDAARYAATNAQSLLSCDSTGTARLWTFAYGDDPWPPITASARFGTGGSPASAAAISPEEDLVAVAGEDGTIRVSSKRGQLLTPSMHHPGGVDSMTFLADTSTLMSVGNSTIRRWDISDLRGEPEAGYAGSDRPMTNFLTVADNGRVRLAANFDGSKSDTVSLLIAKAVPVRIGTPIEQRHFKFEPVPPTAVRIALSNDGNRAVWTTGKHIFFLNVTNGKEPTKLLLPEGDHATAVAVNQSAGEILVATHRVKLPDGEPPNSAPRLRFYSWPADGQPKLKIEKEGRHVALITSLAALSPPEESEPNSTFAFFSLNDPNENATPLPIAAFAAGDKRGRVTLWSRDAEIVFRGEPKVDDRGRELQVYSLTARPGHAEFLAAFALPETSTMTSAEHQAAGVHLQMLSFDGKPQTPLVTTPRFLRGAAFNATGTLLAIAGGSQTPGASYARLDLTIFAPDTLRHLSTIQVPDDYGKAAAVWFDAEDHIVTVDEFWKERNWTTGLATLIEKAEQRLAAWDLEDRYSRLFSSAESARKLSNSDVARNRFHQAAILREDVDQPWIVVGRSIYDPVLGSGDIDLAKEALDKALSVNPYNILALLARGKVAYGSSNFAEAEKFFSRAVETPNTYLVVPDISATFHNFNIQLRNMAMGLRRQSHYEPAAFLAYSIYHQDRWSDAINALSKLIEEYGGSAKDFETRAYVNAQLNQFDEAIRDADEAIAKLSGKDRRYTALEFFSKHMTAADLDEKLCVLTFNWLKWREKAGQTTVPASDHLTRALTACRNAMTKSAGLEPYAKRIEFALRANGSSGSTRQIATAVKPAAVWRLLSEKGDPEPIREFLKQYGSSDEAALAGRWLAAHAADALVSKPPAAETVFGFWRSDDRRWIIEIKRLPDGLYVLLDRNTESLRSEDGDRIGEMRLPTDTQAPWQLTGRHVWGGTKTNDIKWGRQGGLVADLIDEATLFVAYLDSKYKGGWTLRRFTPEAK